MTKSEIIDQIAASAGITKAQAGKAIDTFTDLVKVEVRQNDRFVISGLGTFKKSHRAARTGTSRLGAKAGEQWSSPAHNTVVFKPAPALKDAVN